MHKNNMKASLLDGHCGPQLKLSWVYQKYMKTRNVDKTLEVIVHQLNNMFSELQFQLLLGSTTSDFPQPGQITQIAELSPTEAETLGSQIQLLQASLHEARSRNLYLTGLVETQKKCDCEQ